jgi:hypothetical protein
LPTVFAILPCFNLTQVQYANMSVTKPISDPVAAKTPDKGYPWWVENIDHKITSEVRLQSTGRDIIAYIRVMNRFDSFLKDIARFHQKISQATSTPL